MKALAIFILIVAVLGSLIGLGWSLSAFSDSLGNFPVLTNYGELWGSLPSFPTPDSYETTLQAFQQFFDFLWGVLSNVGKTVFYFGYDIVNVLVYVLNWSNWGFVNG